MPADAKLLADRIEQTVKGTQFEPVWTDEELLLIVKALRGELYVSLPSVIEQHRLSVYFNKRLRKWTAQDCHYNALTEGDTLDDAVQALLSKLIRCQRCQLTTTRQVHEFYCRAEDCEVRAFTCEPQSGNG